MKRLVRAHGGTVATTSEGLGRGCEFVVRMPIAPIADALDAPAAVERLRSRAGDPRRVVGAGVQLVAITGWGQEFDRRRSAEAGFDAHLVKPVDHADVMRCIAVARRASPRTSGPDMATPAGPECRADGRASSGRRRQFALRAVVA